MNEPFQVCCYALTISSSATRIPTALLRRPDRYQCAMHDMRPDMPPSHTHTPPITHQMPQTHTLCPPRSPSASVRAPTHTSTAYLLLPCVRTARARVSCSGPLQVGPTSRNRRGGGVRERETHQRERKRRWGRHLKPVPHSPSHPALLSSPVPWGWRRSECRGTLGAACRRSSDQTIHVLPLLSAGRQAIVNATVCSLMCR